MAASITALICFLCRMSRRPPCATRTDTLLHYATLVRSHHSVGVASLTRSDKERKGVSALEEQCASVITAPIGRTAAWARMLLALPTPRPSTFGYFSDRKSTRLNSSH